MSSISNQAGIAGLVVILLAASPVVENKIAKKKGDG
jgi:hypothetical protein